MHSPRFKFAPPSLIPLIVAEYLPVLTLLEGLRVVDPLRCGQEVYELLVVVDSSANVKPLEGSLVQVSKLVYSQLVRLDRLAGLFK